MDLPHSSVVFLRAVNVGGHQKCQPAVLAKSLGDFDVVNIGAAGTLVVRKKVSDSKLRAEIVGRLGFAPEMMICPGREILALANDQLFGPVPAGEDVRQMFSIMQKPPKNPPPLPFDQPAGNKWQVRVVTSRGRFALSFWRPQRQALIYPNAVIEKYFGVPATTRGWNTISAICKSLLK